MSKHFCILIPSKILRIEKRFHEKLQEWIEYCSNEHEYDPNSRVSRNYYRICHVLYYSVSTLAEFGERPDVCLDLPEEMYARYHVIDFEAYHMEFQILHLFLSWLAKIYSYGEVGLLSYWSNFSNRSSPPVTVGNTEESILNLSASNLPLDIVMFVSLSNYLS